MDLGFFRRQQSFTSRSAARLEYRVLVATLEAMQSGSAAAHAEVVGAGQGEPAECCHNPLVELLLGGPGWREAIVAQGGCFNASRSGNRGKTM